MAKNIIYFSIYFNVEIYHNIHFTPLIGKEIHSTCLLDLICSVLHWLSIVLIAVFFSVCCFLFPQKKVSILVKHRLVYHGDCHRDV